MSISKKFHEFLKDFPIDIEWRINLTKDLEGFVRDNLTYYGPRLGSMKNGSYGICFDKQSNGGLVIRQGNWKEDKLNGKGSAYYIPKPVEKEASIIIWKEGQWIEDNLNGKGIIRQYNTNKKKWVVSFVGQFKNGYKHGYGFSHSNGFKYKGEFQNDCFHGRGRLTKAEGNFYDGEFSHGRPSGKGLQRRDTQFVVYDQNQKQVFSMPVDTEKLPIFYSSIIEKI